MNPFTYYHGINFPDSVREKISNLTSQGYFNEIHPVQQLNMGYHADRFNADGTPAVFDPNSIFPCYAAHYLGVPIPETLLNVPEGYCTHAAIAAYQWLEKVTMNGQVDLNHFDGESFTAQVGGEDAHFTFPTTVLRMMCHSPSNTSYCYGKTCAVIPWPDVSENNEDWKDGTLPQYAEVQAHLLLWCWWYVTDVLKRHTECPTDCYIVRITGNTPGDVSVRVVHSDPPKQESLVNRIVKRVKGKANPVEDNMRVRKQGTWQERKQEDENSAYRVEDPNIYAIVREYMETRTQRKTLEAESNALKDQMDALAIKLADMTSVIADAGTVVDVNAPGAGNVEYRVKHIRKASRPSATVSADLVLQFFPEYSQHITTTVVPRGSVTVEAT